MFFPISMQTGQAQDKTKPTAEEHILARQKRDRARISTLDCKKNNKNKRC